MRKQAAKWLRQAEADLKAAKDSFEHGNFEWSCFQSQQSAEKSLKALLYNKGYTSIVTHSAKRLVTEALKIDESLSELSTDARFLDMFYIPTRYPNGLDEDMAPTDFYEEEDAQKCLNSATSILNVVKKHLRS